MAETLERQWANVENERFKKRLDRLGVVPGANAPWKKIYRSPKLALLDSYYEFAQHDSKPTWEAASDLACDGDYIPIRKRQPKIKANYAKVLCQRVASKLVGEGTFPKFTVENDPDTEEFIRMVIKASRIKSRILEPVRRMLASGSVFVRFFYVEGALQMEHFLSKYCYPVFNKRGELVEVTIKYVYPDKADLDERGNPKLKWYKLTLTQTADILYDNPEFSADSVSEPEFTVVESVEHGFGFVQGQWLSTCEPNDEQYDGESLIEPILDIVDDESYSFSQSSQVLSYNQDPQLTLTGMDVDTVSELVRSSQKAWNLGREGKAEFIETDLGAVERAKENREEVRLLMQDLTRVVFLNPEKFNAQAMSGKAMEIMHGPLVELINELRPVLEQQLSDLVVKLALSMLLLAAQGQEVPVVIPEGWQPTSLSLEVVWPPVFPMTIEDTKQRLSAVIQATNANILSRETGTKWIASDFGVEDIEEELAKIASQPVINPFGGF